jgi:ADP-ribosylglycohydrolase
MSYGLSFAKWIKSPIPYNSYGNGAAMRIGPVGLPRLAIKIFHKS